MADLKLLAYKNTSLSFIHVCIYIQFTLQSMPEMKLLTLQTAICCAVNLAVSGYMVSFIHSFAFFKCVWPKQLV